MQKWKGKETCSLARSSLLNQRSKNMVQRRKKVGTGELKLDEIVLILPHSNPHMLTRVQEIEQKKEEEKGVEQRCS